MEINITSGSAQDTKKVAKALAGIVDFGDVLVVVGELGGGKTTFLSEFGRAFGVAEDITSPSFTIINIYGLKEGKRFVHIDLYRLDNMEQISNTEVEEYIEDDFSITCIEWGDKIAGHIKKDYLLIIFSYVLKEGEDTLNKRSIIIKSKSRYWDKKLRIIKDRLPK